MTDAFFMGDTRIYVRDISNSASLGSTFWYAGHPFWRPLGWLISRLDHRGNPAITLLSINWEVGLVNVLIVYALSSKFSERAWVPYFVAVLFLFANPILNYVQSGQPYMTGLMFLLLGFYLLVREVVEPRHPWRTAIICGVCLACGVCTWIPYVFSLPAIGLFPLIYAGYDSHRLNLVVRTCLVCAFVGALVYISMALHLGLHSIGEVKTWVATASHGDLPDTPLKAIQRMLFTLGRSVINMGDDGRLFKRYAVHDPFNPVTIFDLMRLSLWKLAFFYLFLLAILFNLVFSKSGKKTLVLLSLTAIPFLAFAVFVFEAGSIERYLPIFPVAVVALSVSLGRKESRQWTKVLALVFIAVVIISNVGATSKVVLNKQQERVEKRLGELQPFLKIPNRIVTVNEQDELYAFNQNFLFNPINQTGQEIDNLVTPHSVQILRWRQIFAEKTLAMWASGGDVWVTKRVLASRPQAQWNWVEGDDPTVLWSDINHYFAQFDMGQQTASEDGFVKVADTPSNRMRFQSIIQEKKGQQDSPH